MNLNVGILKEFLDELPDDYNILVESVPNYFEPVMIWIWIMRIILIRIVCLLFQSN